MNHWSNKIGYAFAIATIIGLFVGLGVLMTKFDKKVDECKANGGHMVELTGGYVCAKLEIIK